MSEARTIFGSISLAIFLVGGAQAQTKAVKDGRDPTIVTSGDIVPPRVVAPCKPGRCPFPGQRVTVLVTGGRLIAGPVHELKEEYEAATGAQLNIVEATIDEHFASLISDVTNRVGKYDISIAGAWWPSLNRRKWRMCWRRWA